MNAPAEKRQRIFNAAIELTDPAGRAAFLDVACTGDQQLRAVVEELLEHDQAAGSFLDQPAIALPEPTESLQPTKECIGVKIGPYKLLQQLGEGGMGTVFLAEQEQPVKRRVALKIIKAGMDSAQVVARFEQERQALAIMDHPNIAKVLDAGTTHTGRPFFVMELVKGIPITRFCDQEHLLPQERLDLFMSVCRAVQHAHQKGIIHRDLKPSNVLIALYDGEPVAKVIDFGVAKAMHQKLTERTMFTEVGSIVGTLEYMAPEQAELNNLDIDTRADIYSLGVLLYELLTGSPPFSSKQLRGTAFTEMMRMIREVEPPKPSTRLSSSDELASIAANRKLEPRRLTSLVTGELDWIVMRALEKDRSRRYETANGLAMDIQRYLSDEPVLAGPPSKAYRLKKFFRRHRVALGTAAAFAALLIVGATGSTWQAVRATRAKTEAVANERKALSAAEAERKANETAQRRLGQIEKSNEILASIFRDLDPQQAEREGLPLAAVLGDRLDQASRQLVADVIGDSLAVARMQNLLGSCLLHLGHPLRAEEVFAKSRETLESLLGPRDPETLTSISWLARAYRESGKLDQATPLVEQTFELRQAVLGANHHDTLVSMHDLAAVRVAQGSLDEGLRIYERTLPLAKTAMGPDHPETLLLMTDLAGAYLNAGKLERAVQLYEQVLPLLKIAKGVSHPETLALMNNLAQAYQDSGRIDDAIALFVKTLALQEEKLGSRHIDTLFTMNNLANAYASAGKTDLALPLLEKTLRLRTEKLGPDHTDTLVSLGSLAVAYQAAAKTDLALPLFERCYEISQSIHGADHPLTLTAASNLAQALGEARKLDQAIPLMEQTLQKTEAVYGPNHAHTLTCVNNLAMALLNGRKFDRALPMFQRTLERRTAALGADHPETLSSVFNIGWAYHSAGEQDQALPWLEQASERAEAVLGADHRLTRHFQANLITVYEKAGRFVRLAEWFSRKLAQLEKTQPADRAAKVSLLARLGSCLLHLERFTDAEPLLRECLTIREAQDADAWTTFNTRSMLGEALAGQEKHGAAEPLLLAGYEGLKEHEATIPPEGKIRLTEALQRLVDFYTATGQAEKADEWRAKQEAATPKEPEPEP